MDKFRSRSLRDANFWSAPAGDCQLVVWVTLGKSFFTQCCKGIIGKAQTHSHQGRQKTPQIKAGSIDSTSVMVGRAGPSESRFLRGVSVAKVSRLRRSEGDVRFCSWFHGLVPLQEN